MKVLTVILLSILSIGCSDSETPLTPKPTPSTNRLNNTDELPDNIRERYEILQGHISSELYAELIEKVTHDYNGEYDGLSEWLEEHIGAIYVQFLKDSKRLDYFRMTKNDRIAVAALLEHELHPDMQFCFGCGEWGRFVMAKPSTQGVVYLEPEWVWVLTYKIEYYSIPNTSPEKIERMLKKIETALDRPINGIIRLPKFSGITMHYIYLDLETGLPASPQYEGWRFYLTGADEATPRQIRSYNDRYRSDWKTFKLGDLE